MRSNKDKGCPRYDCNRCGHSWIGRTDRRPTFCPECRSKNWDAPKPRMLKCHVCGYGWECRSDSDPKRCPSCRSLTEVRLGENLRSVGDYAFRDCSFLAKAYFEGEMPEMGNSVFYGTTDGFTVVYASEHGGSWKDYDETRKQADGESGIDYLFVILCTMALLVLSFAILLVARRYINRR